VNSLPCPRHVAPIPLTATPEEFPTESILSSTPRYLRSGIAVFGLLMLALLSLLRPALAVEAQRVPLDVPVLDLTDVVERNKSDGDVIQISTAPGADGIVRRIAVRARESGARPDWIVFALTNDSDEQIDRLLVAPFHRLIGSGVVWPDLGDRRIEAITASQGLRPEREEAPDADIFQITLDPGTTVTFVAELKSPNLPQLYLFEPEAYRQKTNGLTLYKGIIIGIAGLLALFLTIIFVVKGAVIFPAAAALAWAVLAYAGLDFGFFQRIFPLTPAIERIYRAGAEVVLAATLLVFLFAYLNLSRWHVRYSHITFIWILGLAGLVGLAVFDAPMAAGIARISIAAVATIGFVLILHLATHGYERAVMLIPTWFLLLVWVTAAGFTVVGQVTRDLVPPSLIGGLVLIVLLIGFTVVQHAFAGGALAQGLVSDTERRALALSGSGDLVFDWDVSADKIFVSPQAETLLGLGKGALEGSAARWLEYMHIADRDRYRVSLDAVIEQRRGKLQLDFRLRSANGAYHWFSLRARPVIGSDGEVIRVIGTLADVTEQRTAQERMLHDAVHDNLTGLPNRELFQDRLTAVFGFSRADDAIRPTVIVIDIDRFKQVNESVGFSAGDSILLTLARRLGRLLRTQDTLARIGGDIFAMIIVSESDPERILALAELIRRAVSTPITFAEREIVLTPSIGLALFDGTPTARKDDALKNAELAMAHAKNQGGNLVEVFVPAMRSDRNDRLALESDLRRALERGEISRSMYQPVVRLADRTHRGLRGAGALGPPASRAACRRRSSSRSPRRAGLIVDLGVYRDGPRPPASSPAWQALMLEVEPPLFASGQRLVSRQLLRHDLLQRREGRAGACVACCPRLAQARADREPGDGEPGICRADAVSASATSARACRSTISAPGIPRWPICSASPSTRSRSTRSFVRADRQRHAAGAAALDRRNSPPTCRWTWSPRARRQNADADRALPARLRSTRKATPSASR
jgi:diguanylate cyclase (GGDEF)-like protein/PAS domain S-box-containing protein